MKILLCCTSIQDEHRSDDNHDSHYPLGLAYLQSYIEHHRPGKDEFINLYLNNVPYEQCYDEIKKNLAEFQPEVFGVSIMTHSRVTAYRMIEYVHENYPDTKIVVGGMHPSVMWKQMVEKYPYIVAVRGEGEVTFNELIEFYAGEKDMNIEDVAGIAFHDGDKVVATAARPLVANIDDLPFPKHELFVKDGKTMGNLLTSRGCPYKCNFCVLDHTSLRKVRFRSGDNIADEVEELITKFPSINTIWIHDDAFMINKERTLEFCEAIIRRGIKTQFVASARFRPIDENVVQKMEQAGFIHVLFGLESGADNVISGMRKGITKEHVRYGSSLFATTKMKATAFLIAGLPGETDETIDETIDFVQEIQNINYLFYDDIGVSMIYPGTEMYTMAKATGKIDDDYWLTDKDVPYYTVENGGVHTYEKLLEMKEKIRQAVSLQHMFTPEGFLKQRKVIPSMLKYAQIHNMTAINNILFDAFNRFGLANEMIKAVMSGDPVDEIVKKGAIAFEKMLINIIMHNNNISTPDQQKLFINKVVAQTKIDALALKEYEARRSAIQYDGDKDKGDIDYKKNFIENKLDINIIGQ
jgi:radical SAM superfamily enzyme YgiQ (UPF0313 family)